jgi:four helix bundle protein
MAIYFDHEKLEVYQAAIAFVAWWAEPRPRGAGRVPSGRSIAEQMDRASTSVPLNIAEGNGKSSPRDRSRYFEIARGSALECAAGLDVLVARKLVAAPEVEPGKALLQRIVAMLTRLMDRLADRVAEAGVEYDPLAPGPGDPAEPPG